MKTEKTFPAKTKSSVSIADAKNHLSALIHKAEKEGSVSLTRRGKITAYIISAEFFNCFVRSGVGFFSKASAIRAKMETEFLLDDSEIQSWKDISPGRTIHL